MLFQTYGDRRNPAVLFFHAMGVTGASSEPIARYLQDRYFCILPTSTVYCGKSLADTDRTFDLYYLDFERIGDHVLNLQESAKELRDKQLRFSPTAQKEVEVLTRLLRDLMTAALDCFRKDDPVAAQLVEPLEETMDCLTEEVRNRHIHRLQNGQCTIQLGFVLNDLLNNFERIGDHCSNIAVSVIEEQDSQMASHAYLHDMKKNGEFAARLQNNLSRYALPPEMPGASPAEPAE